MKSRFLSLLIALAPLSATAQNLIPMPKEMHNKGGKPVAITSVSARVDSKLDVPNEGYTLDIRGKKAILRARTQQGLTWAKKTLNQLRDEQGRVPQVCIRDYPAFAMRGFMHDTGRNFQTVEMLKRDIKLMSDYKLNVFHWHLTDNPAWRIECKTYPQLNDAKYQKKGRNEGEFYTYDQIREVIRYASELGITVIPEIDMPGHSEYFDTTFGFKMASPQGMKVLEDCLNEFFTEIPASMCPYLHIGSDEVRISNTKEFMQFCEDLVRKAGRTPLCWDPGLPSSEGTIGQVWQAVRGKDIAKKGYDKLYLDSYMGYLNHDNAINNTNRFLLHHACSVDQGNEKALGGILCLWNDVRAEDKQKLMDHSGGVNGLVAFAERMWMGGTGVSLDEEHLVPSPKSEMYQKLADFEQRLAYHRDHFLYDWNMRWAANSQLHWRVTLPERRGSDRNRMKWVDAWGGAINMKFVCQKHGVEVEPKMDAWAETELWVDRDTVIRAMVGFENPARSNRMSDGIGPQGLWEVEGRLWVGDTEVFPAEPWKEPGKYQSHGNTWGGPLAEMSYTDEQFPWTRTPAIIPLHAGKNIIRMYCPRVFPHNEWFFTFLPVTVDANGHVSEVQGVSFK